MDKEKAPRSTAYPSLPLSEAIEKLEHIPSSVGHRGSYTRDTLVQGMGYKAASGASSRAVASLVHYGLLSRVGSNYEISGLGKRWLFNTSDDDRQVVKKQAALNPKIFSRICEQFSGQAFPTLLHNILVTQYGILPTVSHDVVRIARETFVYAGLMNENGILTLEQQDVESYETSLPEVKEYDHRQDDELTEATAYPLIPSSISGSIDMSSQVVILALSSGKATINVPVRLTKADINKLKMQIDILGGDNDVE